MTRLRSNLKSRRKLSLPMLVGQFHHPAAGGGKTPETDQQTSEVSVEVSVSDEDLTASVATPESDDQTKTAWLGFGKSRANKIRRNKPRRWPSTPAFPPAARPVVASAPPPPPPPPQPPPPPPTGTRPQPYIQGYHLTLPSFLTGVGSSNSNRNLNHHQGIPAVRPCYQVYKHLNRWPTTESRLSFYFLAHCHSRESKQLAPLTANSFLLLRQRKERRERKKNVLRFLFLFFFFQHEKVFYG